MGSKINRQFNWYLKKDIKSYKSKLWQSNKVFAKLNINTYKITSITNMATSMEKSV